MRLRIPALAATFAALAPLPAAAQATRNVAVMASRLEIPTELGPAGSLYMNCLLSSKGIQMSGVPANLPKVEKGADCSGVRVQAAELGDALLKRHGVKSARERRERVEAMLASVEAFVESAGTPPDAASGEDTITMTDAIRAPAAMGPAVDKYMNCLSNAFVAAKPAADRIGVLANA